MKKNTLNRYNTRCASLPAVAVEMLTPSKLRLQNYLAAACFAVVVAAAPASAAVITAVAPAASDMKLTDYRTTTVVKANDADFDNVYGTAGNWIYSVTDTINGSKLPTYITSIGPSAGVTFAGLTANYSQLDSATAIPSASVPNVNGWVLTKAASPRGVYTDFADITLGATGTLPSDGFRLGIVLSGSPGDILPQALRIGSTPITVDLAAKDNYLTSSFYFFDVKGATGGEVLKLQFMAQGTADSGNKQTGITGLTFDTIPAIPEPGSLVLMGVALGSLLLFRRRKA